MAIISGTIIAAATLAVLRMNLESMEDEIRWRLHIQKMGAHLMFREIR